MKKDYSKPTIKAVEIELSEIIADSNTVEGGVREFTPTDFYGDFEK